MYEQYKAETVGLCKAGVPREFVYGEVAMAPYSRLVCVWVDRPWALYSVLSVCCSLRDSSNPNAS